MKEAKPPGVPAELSYCCLRESEIPVFGTNKQAGAVKKRLSTPRRMFKITNRLKPGSEFSSGKPPSAAISECSCKLANENRLQKKRRIYSEQCTKTLLQTFCRRVAGKKSRTMRPSAHRNAVSGCISAPSSQRKCHALAHRHARASD